MASTALFPAPPLPDTRHELLNSRVIKNERSILDYVEDINTALWENPDYKALHHAIFNPQAVTKNCVADDVLAAQMIVKYATENDVPQVLEEEFWTIVLAMRSVRKRYGNSRKQRKARARAARAEKSNGEAAE